MPSSQRLGPAPGAERPDAPGEPARRALQQAAVAAFGLFALESRDLALTMDHALTIVTRELDLPMAGVVRLLPQPGKLAMIDSRGPVGLDRGQEFEVDPRMLAVEHTTAPIVVEDWRTERRFDASTAWKRAGVASTLSVTLLVEGRPWGRLAAMDVRPHRFSVIDVDFLQSMAHLLAAALERARSEGAQAAVARFGLFALESADVAVTVEHAVDVAVELLGAPAAGLFRLTGAARGQLMHGFGPIGLTAREEHDAPDGVMPATGAMAASVLVRGRPWGRLVVMDSRARLFNGSELDVLQSVANVLAAALERQQVEDAQAAVAAFGRFALESRDITATIERAVDVVTRTLDAPMGALVELLGPGRVAVLHSRGPVTLGPGEEFEIDPELLTTYVSSEPLVVRDWRSDSRFGRTPTGRPAPARRKTRGRRATSTAAEIRSSLSVTVPVDGWPWGRLIVSYTEPRQIGAADVDFVQSVAHVLAAALERERVDAGRAATAAFGAFALESTDLAATVERAVDVVARVLEAPLGAVVRLRGRPDRLSVVQAWGPVGIDLGQDYAVDRRLIDAIRLPEPLIIEDWRTDERFTTPVLARSAQSIASLSAALLVGGHVWGRLIIADTRPRQFTDTESHLLTSVANVLAAAMDAERRRGPMSPWSPANGERDPLRMDLGGVPQLAPPVTEIAVLDRSGVIVSVNQAWEDFARDNGGDPSSSGVGMSYPAICDEADDPLSRRVARAVRAAVRGELPAPVTVLIPCHSRSAARWFDLLISSRLDDDGSCRGATITLSTVAGSGRGHERSAVADALDRRRSYH